jgi:hypothetical protein
VVGDGRGTSSAVLFRTQIDATRIEIANAFIEVVRSPNSRIMPDLSRYCNFMQKSHKRLGL